MAIKEIRIQQKTTYRNKAVDLYFDELIFPVLTPDEEVALFYKVKQGDQRAVERLTQCNLRFVVSVAKTFVNNNPEILLDLIQEGSLGLIHAIRDFDVTKGFKFISYAVWHIRQRILLYLSQNKTIKPPTGIDSTEYTIKKIHDKLETRLERKPTPDEIFQEFFDHANTRKTPFTAEQIKSRIFDWYESDQILSLDTYVNDENDTTIGDLIADKNAAMDLMHGKESNIKLIEMLISRLSEKDRQVIILTYGLDGQGSGPARASLSLGLTLNRIKQIHDDTMIKLQRHAKKMKIEEHFTFEQ
jgi:RNA polymerase primary sigma factor